MSEHQELDRLLTSLPHGEPFRFVSELTMLEPLKRGAGVWVTTGGEGFFAGHFPGKPIVPGVLLAEALAQLCGLIAFAGKGRAGDRAEPARLAHVDVKVHAAVQPPARIELSGSFVRGIGRLLLFDVCATTNGTIAADGRIVLAKPLL